MKRLKPTIAATTLAWATCGALPTASADDPATNAPAPQARTSTDRPAAPDVYPRGDVFPLGLYALVPDAMPDTRDGGWTVAQTYSDFTDDWKTAAHEAGYRFIANLPGEDEIPPDDEFIALIQDLAEQDALSWWDYPEERRYWIDEEMQMMRNLARWTREHDPQQRPRFMYLPGHYDAQAISKYIDVLDIIPASVYPVYQEQPHAWARWILEQTDQAIDLAGATRGPDYLNDEKTLAAVIELFRFDGERDMTYAGAYHTFWQSIASGAKGVLVYAHFYRDASPGTTEAWKALQKAALELTSPEGFGAAALFGDVIDGVTIDVESGPKLGPAFLPHQAPRKVRLPSIDVRTVVHGPHLYLFAVNSAEEPVVATIGRLPLGDATATLPFEDYAKLNVEGGAVRVNFEPLGVRLLTVRSAKLNPPEANED